MKEPTSSSNFRVSSKTDVGLNGSFPLVAKEAPSNIAPGTAVIGSGASIKATPALRSVLEMEFGLATSLSLLHVSASARHRATSSLSFRTRVAELALHLRS